jgi:uncharacterized protein YndB with AHSA1/START domain
MKDEPVIFEKIFHAPITSVWKAITDRDAMKQWYFELPEFKPEVGFEFQFSGGTEENTYLHICKVTEVIPPKKIAYTWRYDGYPGNSLVTWELFEEGSNTRLKLTHSGLGTFPQHVKDFARNNFAEGWKEIVGTLLMKYLEGK